LQRFLHQRAMVKADHLHHAKAPVRRLRNFFMSKRKNALLQANTAALLALTMVALLFSHAKKPDGTDSGLWVPNGPSNGVAIVAACKGRHSTLLGSVDSWLQVRGASRIVLVDWDSKPPYLETLPAYVLNHPRFQLVSVTEQPKYILTVAANFAASFVPPQENILKLDCDNIITSDFLIAHPLRPNEAYVWDWEKARDENELHLNGVFYTSSQNFAAVGGYDERIQSYGWDDSDLKNRLQESGVNFRHMDMNRMHHLFHNSSHRMEYVPGFSGSPDFETSLNRLVAEHMPRWNKHLPATNYVTKLKKGFQRVYEAKLLPETMPQSQRNMISAELLDKAMKTAAYESMIHFEGFHWSPAWDRLPTPYVVRLVTSYHNAYNQGSGNMLTVHLMHGLGNRLRALASASVLARRAERWLRVVWVPDIHIGATLDQLFMLEASNLLDVWSEFDPAELTLYEYDLYDYMDPQQIYKYVNELSPRHIYLRTAYRLNNTMMTKEEEDDAVNVFIVANSVQQIIDSVELPVGSPVIGVHIRNVDPRVELPNLPRSEYPEAGWEEMIAARKNCNLTVFELEMLRFLSINNSTAFYVASDTPSLIATLRRKFDGIYSLKFDCRDRSVHCLQIALADMILLGRTAQILGSYWSSFTEMAASYAHIEPRFASVDF
jgi:hypothetical protein